MRIIGLLIVSVVVAVLMLKQLQTSGPQAKQTSTAIAQASQNVAATNLQSAKSLLDVQFTSSQTYAGANVASAGATLVRADAASYCVQAGAGTTIAHLAGPGGTIAPGPC